MSEKIEAVWWRHDLQERYSRTRMTIWRWETDGHLPKPDMIIAGKPAWRPTTILEFERRSAGHAA
jgi:predicted DNA-binding transcriptional regulator AlpA